MPMPRKPDPPQRCDHCGALMERKRFNGTLESLSNFLHRRYCDRACMAAAFVKDAPSHEDTFHWRARRLRGRACESCGATTKLHAHHIDGNEANNSPENIQTLCATCHITHHHRARRAGQTVAGRKDSAG